LLAISQNTALFSLLGTTYGGNGQTTFALPDLRGRVPIHMGQGPGLTTRSEGETGGSETISIQTHHH
jgi:microcystin-dependent protein